MVWACVSALLFPHAADSFVCCFFPSQVGFFRLYSHEFDFKELILSIRTGGYLDKKKKVWGQSAKKDRHLLCVEDPFDVTHNLGRGCDPTALYEIRGEFMRAFSVLREGGSIFDVCVAYTKQFRGA